MISAGDDRRRSRRLFLAVLVLTAGFHAILIADGRVPRTDPTRFAYERQRALLEARPGPGTVPLWLASTSHGVVSSRALFEQGGILPSLLLLVGPAATAREFLPFFYGGLFIEELLFLVGCWALSRRFFASPVVAFIVCVSALGSAFCFDQLWLSFRAIAAIPLLLWLLHGFFDDGSRMKALLAGNLLALQALGSPLGFAIVAPLVVAIYFAGRRLVLREDVFRNLRGSGLRRRDGLVAAAILFSWLAPLLTACLGTAALDAPPPPPCGARDVLTVAGLANPWTLVESLHGVSLSSRGSLYAGSFTLAFAALAFLALPREVAWRGLAAWPLGLLLLGTTMVLFWLVVPSLRPARTPEIGLPLLRLGILFLSGAGLQRCLTEDRSRPLRVAGSGLLFWAVVLAMLSGGVQLPLVEGYPSTSPTLSSMPGAASGQPDSRVPELAGVSAFSAALAGGILLLWSSRRRAAPLALALLFILHPVDVFGWKFRSCWLASSSAASAHAGREATGPIHEAPRPEERWTEDVWMRPMGRLTEVLHGAATAKIAGRSGDEIQFYTSAHPCPDDEVARRLRHPEFSGDLLFIDGADDGREVSLRAVERLMIPYDVEESEGNSMTVRVTCPHDGAWITFADCWDPGWRAIVNGTARDIHRANLAFKALRLDGGSCRVQFQYRAPLRTSSFWLLGLNALFWLAWILRAAARLSLGEGDIA